VSMGPEGLAPTFSGDRPGLCGMRLLTATPMEGMTNLPSYATPVYATPQEHSHQGPQQSSAQTIRQSQPNVQWGNLNPTDRIQPNKQAQKGNILDGEPVGPGNKKKDRFCQFCSSIHNLRLCHCKTYLICSQDCLSALYAESENYRLKCESTMEKKKADQYKKSAKKKTAQLNKNTAPEDKARRDSKGRFVNQETFDEQSALKAAKNEISNGSKQKRQVIKHARLYNIHRPHNQIAIREAKTCGKGGYWYLTPGYDPLQSKAMKPATTPEIRQESDTDDENVPDVENRDPDSVIQARKDYSKSYCALCHESIGPITGRLKCNALNCKTHASLHLLCVGLYPADANQRRIIQKSYFCKSHAPQNMGQLGHLEENVSVSNTKQKAVPNGKVQYVRMSERYSTLLNTTQIPLNRVVRLAEYKLVLKSYVGKFGLKDPSSPLRLVLNKSLGDLIGKEEKEIVSYVLLKKSLIKSGDLSDVREDPPIEVVDVANQNLPPPSGPSWKPPYVQTSSVLNSPGPAQSNALDSFDALDALGQGVPPSTSSYVYGCLGSSNKEPRIQNSSEEAETVVPFSQY